MLMFLGHWRQGWGLLCCEGGFCFILRYLGYYFLARWRGGDGDGGGVYAVDVGNPTPTPPRMHAWMHLNPVLFRVGVAI